jgi:hypothetical protein
MRHLLWSLLLLALPGGDDPVAVDFATLSDFTYTEGMELPASVTKYDERQIVITGFMRRETDGSGEVEFFMLINGACDCDGTPKLNEILFCAMPEGETTKILSGTVKLTGTLYVGEEEEDGEVIGLYAMDVDKIEQN